MLGEFPDFDALYGSAPVRTLAANAARVEGEGYGRWTRAREVVEFSRRMGYVRLGLAHCRDCGRQAALAADYFRNRGLEVILPSDAEPASAVSDCDPVEQAAGFERAGTDLNVIVGMCVGHDTLFMRRSAAPVTSLVVRDLRLRDNPAAALYTRTGYLKSALYHSGASPRAVPRVELDDATIGRLAVEVRDAGLARDDPPCRLEEVMAFAARAGVRRIGVLYCVGFREEAAALRAVLSSNGFRVSSICCKSGAVPKERLGLADAEKVRPGQVEMICNPLAQAVLLDASAAELILLLGQCVGHDSAAMARLRTPAVCLVAKDRVTAHNTMAVLHDPPAP
jgi:uncharacterized metal-binding protein